MNIAGSRWNDISVLFISSFSLFLLPQSVKDVAVDQVLRQGGPLGRLIWSNQFNFLSGNRINSLGWFFLFSENCVFCLVFLLFAVGGGGGGEGIELKVNWLSSRGRKPRVLWNWIWFNRFVLTAQLDQFVQLCRDGFMGWIFYHFVIKKWIDSW